MYLPFTVHRTMRLSSASMLTVPSSSKSMSIHSITIVDAPAHGISWPIAIMVVYRDRIYGQISINNFDQPFSFADGGIVMPNEGDVIEFRIPNDVEIEVYYTTEF